MFIKSMSKGYSIIFLLLALTQTSISATPFIAQYIIPFDISVNDLRQAVSIQLSRDDFKTNSFSSDNVSVSHLIYQSQYNDKNRTIIPKTQSSYHDVSFDSIDLTVTYQASMHKIPTTKKTFNGTTKLKVYANYTKKLIAGQDTISIEKLVVWVDKNSFQMSYTGNPNGNETKKLNQINNGVISGKKNTTILHLLQTEQFTSQSLLAIFKENLVSQKISPTYNKTYLYQTEELNVNFDMTTSGIQSIPHGITHYLKGTINNFKSDFEKMDTELPYEEGYHTAYSINFVNYFLEQTFENRAIWKNYKINKDKFQTSIFKFRLIDLQYLFPKITQKYSQYYLSNIYINCQPKSFGKWGIDQIYNKVNLEVIWKCQGYIDGVNPPPLVLDFQSALTYLIEVRLSNSYLYTYISKVFIEYMAFNRIDGAQLLDYDLSLQYAQQIIRSLEGYTLGTNFKVRDNSEKIALKQNAGIYIG